MTPAARVQAAIELVDAIVEAARHGGAAADTLVARYFSTRRYAGSKDRRAVRELVYAAVRAVGEVPVSGRAAMLAAITDDEERQRLFDGSPHGPAPYQAGEPVAAAGLAPQWLVDRLAASGVGEDELIALVERAPLDIRVNVLRRDMADIRAALPGAEPIAGLPDALRLPAGADVGALAGQVEVQDAGSQLVTLAAGAGPGMAVIDLCAGGGGKTLALAAAMGGRGRILASDTNRDRLSRLGPRAERAGVTIAETRLLDPTREAAALADWAGQADIVLIDAPCSGTGTWRRNPEGRWRLTPAALDRLAATQRHLLDLSAALVKPGGAIAYIVCSMLDEEGADQANAFLARHPDWQADEIVLPAGTPRAPGLRLSPARDSTDGFFVARLRAPC